MRQKNDGSGNSGSSSKLFVAVSIISVIGCIIGLFICCLLFISSTKTFNQEVTNALHSVSQMNKDEQEVANSMITHMDSLVSLQKSGMTNDLMSFVYGVLSTVLVGLCASFVAKSRDNADKAEAKARETKEAIDQAHKAAEKANEFKYRLKLIIIFNTELSAELALSEQNQVLANKSFVQIRDNIVSLFSDDEFINCKNVLGGDETQQVYDELCSLKERVTKIIEESEKKSSDPKLNSLGTSAKNYLKWIEDALDHIDAATEEPLTGLQQTKVVRQRNKSNANAQAKKRSIALLADKAKNCLKSKVKNKKQPSNSN